MLVTVALVGSPPALASASPERREGSLELHPREAPTLEVRVVPQTLDTELDRARIEERGRAALGRRSVGLEPGERIVVELAGDGDGDGYHVTVRALRNGVPIPDEPTAFDHEGSIDTLLVRTEAVIDDAADRLITERPPLANTGPAARPQARGGERAPSDVEPEPRKRRFRLRIPGAIAAGLGASMMAGGTILVTEGAQPVEGDLLVPGDLRPPGAVLLGAGAAFLLGGVSLLILDAARCRKHRASCDDVRPTLRRST